MSDRKYFATLEPTRDGLGGGITNRVQQYFGNARVMEILAKQRIAYRYYYDLGLDWAGWGSQGTTNQMQRGGEEGELALIRINHCRSLVRKQIAMISNAKFDRRPRASSDEYDSLHATEQCGYALDHYVKSGGLELRRLERIESASTLGVGLTHYGWDSTLGKEHATDPDTKRIVYTGDVSATNVLPWDLICDPWKPWKEQRHCIVRFPKVNRWELAAKYPKFASEILDSPAQTIVPFFTPVSTAYDGPTPDDTEIFVFYHVRSSIPGLERGRQSVVLGSGVVVDDGPLDIGRLPICRITEAEVMGSPFGYPSFWEYTGIQELYDSLQSIVATNQSTFGAQNLVVKTGVDPRPVQLGGGLAVYVCNDPEKDVRPLQLTKSPAEIFPHMQTLKGDMTELAGLASVDLGQAQGDRQSGSALALLSSQSIRNASPYQTSDVEGLKDEAQIVLRFLRSKATRPITIGITERGQSGQSSYEKAITGADLGDVDSVDIELDNPLMQTPEGRIAALQTLAQLKIAITSEMAMSVIKYGNFNVVTDSTTKEEQRIKLENKQITRGQTPRALLSDDHMRHCRDHTQTMSDAGRDDPKVQAAFIAHVANDHYRLFYGTDPEQDKLTGMYRVQMMALCGIVPPPPNPMQGGAALTASPEQKALTDGKPPPDAGPANRVPGNQPRLPTNPATGGQWSPHEPPPVTA